MTQEYPRRAQDDHHKGRAILALLAVSLPCPEWPGQVGQLSRSLAISSRATKLPSRNFSARKPPPIRPSSPDRTRENASRHPHHLVLSPALRHSAPLPLCHFA